MKQKKIKVTVAECGTNINIEKNLVLNILWPEKNEEIRHNSINNNALVFKLQYKEFSMLFTGDIEEETEKVLVNKYKNTNALNAKVLKVAHHGSKSSSTEEFLQQVRPKIALIGVGKNNTFGHPNEDVLERIKKYGVIYRTDENGEITLEVNKKGQVKIKKQL